MKLASVSATPCPRSQSLNVKINPQAAGYVLSPNPDMSYTVYELDGMNIKWPESCTIIIKSK